MKITGYHYYPESDEIDLTIDVEKPREAISVPLEDEFFFLRLDPTTKQIVGATVLNASQWFAALAHAFATKSLDNSDVQLLLEKKVEEFALHRA